MPGLLEWPARIKTSRVESMACVTSDYFATILDVLDIDLPDDRPYDGISLLPLIDDDTLDQRPQRIAFEIGTQAALSDNRYKLVYNAEPDRRHRADNGSVPVARWELYDLIEDPSETVNIAAQQPAIVSQMKAALKQWQASCRTSAAGEDYNSQ